MKPGDTDGGTTSDATFAPRSAEPRDPVVPNQTNKSVADRRRNATFGPSEAQVESEREQGLLSYSDGNA